MRFFVSRRKYDELRQRNVILLALIDDYKRQVGGLQVELHRYKLLVGERAGMFKRCVDPNRSTFDATRPQARPSTRQGG